MKVVILAGGRGMRKEYSCQVPLAITRCGNFYGGGDLNYNRLVAGTIRPALLGERPIIRSDGAYVRDYFYVKDAVAAYPLEAGLRETIAWYRSHLTLSSDVPKA